MVTFRLSWLLPTFLLHLIFVNDLNRSLYRIHYVIIKQYSIRYSVAKPIFSKKCSIKINLSKAKYIFIFNFDSRSTNKQIKYYLTSNHLTVKYNLLYNKINMIIRKNSRVSNFETIKQSKFKSNWIAINNKI